MLNIGMASLILIAIFAVVIFGPSKIPVITRTMSKTMRVIKGIRKWL